jgi:hypothetical protein
MRGGLIGRETSMQRIQYHRYSGPEEMRLAARHRHGFLRRPGSPSIIKRLVEASGVVKVN